MTRSPAYTGRLLVQNFVDSPSAVVPPGGTYQTTCRPRDQVLLSEILIRYFTLTELYVGNHFVKVKENTTIGDTREYLVEPAGINVQASVDVRIILRNDTDRSQLAREANFEERT